MTKGWHILLILAAILGTFVYGYVALLHSFMASYCHGIDNIVCIEEADRFEAAGRNVLAAYGAGYALIAAAVWALIRWRRAKK